MQKLIISFMAALSLAAFPAYAEHGYDRGGYGRNHNRGSADNSVWAGVAIIGAIAGLALLAEQNKQEAVAPSYVEPAYQAPVNYAPPQPASNVWYYCSSSAMYYPYTKACPEGWQAVPASSY